MIKTVFAHERSLSLIECFPRSGSSVILSNLAQHCLNQKTSYKTVNINSMRHELYPKKPIHEYKNFGLLVREPVDRFESFFISKICKGEPKSIMAVLALIDFELFELLSVTNLPIVKKLKPYFQSLSPTIDLLNHYLHPSFAMLGTKIHSLNLRLMDFEIKTFVQLILDNAIPPDIHLIPQSTLKKYQLCSYTNLFRLCNFEQFSDWYSNTTGDSFCHSYNSTQPNNRLLFKKVNISSSATVAEVRHLLNQTLSPAKYALITDEIRDEIINIYSGDFSLFQMCFNG